ncbi:unnamed protein product [Danaus chrysippus]|uniref:(African queen) hypothetical protein n=1 Tax=Danaus chrysippus TaxID=151541 RepID=A0A8J2VV48_9NEOP|nr:unnamed protein product [Danaus chrysippus]
MTGCDSINVDVFGEFLREGLWGRGVIVHPCLRYRSPTGQRQPAHPLHPLVSIGLVLLVKASPVSIEALTREVLAKQSDYTRIMSGNAQWNKTSFTELQVYSFESTGV